MLSIHRDLQQVPTLIIWWALWAIQNYVKVLKSPIAAVLKYLHMNFEKGVGYGANNAARSALSLILPCSQGATTGKQFLVKWFYKGSHEQRPPQPWYDSFWNVQVVLDWLMQRSKDSELSLKLSSYNIVVVRVITKRPDYSKSFGQWNEI